MGSRKVAKCFRRCCVMRGKFIPPPTPIPHNKPTFIKMTNLLILRLSSVVEEFLLTG